ATTPSGLQSFNPATGAGSTLIPAAPGANFQALFPANNKLYGINNGQMVTVTPGTPAPTPISMSATYLVDTKVEDMALFNEAGWQLENFYYDPKMHGKDWNAIRAKFAKIVPSVYDRTDLYRMMGEMMEELVSSHLGATPPAADFPGSNNEATAFLGIDLDPAKLDAGQAVVARVVPNSPADHPTSQLLVGDRIVEIDGEKVGPASVASLLNRKSLRKVAVTVERNGSRTTITIKPGSNAQRTALEYQAYVEQQRAMVAKLSEGKLGYVHIAAMDQASLGQFLREIRTEGQGKKGLIIDVRFNGGGSTAVDVLAVLIKTPWMIRTTKGDTGVRLSENIYRGDGLEIPTALMSNSFSFSNAEIITEGFRKLKLGPIVGERTPGYVIGTGAAFLWDGGSIRMPMIGAYATNGDNLENDGRRPDHTVWFDPNAWGEGRDLQLERTISELLKNIK
ncbi:MAG TPA: S41 family peptidase, partial [Fimbriimonas sp.]|nr:S41 family peptidase [Fimbriimonas sp.]